MPAKQIVIPKLSSSERSWLSEVYSLAIANKKINFREIWAKLHRKLPKDFRPASMNADLIDASGEEIRLMGVVALQKSVEIFKKVNRIVLSIKEILLKKPLEENITVEEIAEESKLPVNEISFVFYLLGNYGGFLDGASYESEGRILKSISVGRNSSTFYRYISFTSIEQLIIYRQNDKKKTETFLKPDMNSSSSETNQTKKLITVNPIFNSKVSGINSRMCFVLMPFMTEWSQRVYRDLIRKNIEELGLQCLRADDLTGQNIIEDIWMGLNQAAIIIADVTNSNPNVMYELGIVHTLGKPSILITQEINNIPFDFRHLRHIEYRENTEAVNNFGIQFKKHLRDIYKNVYPLVKFK